VAERVFIGLGSNLGDREAFIQKAMAQLAKTPSIELVRCATLYETEPVGHEDQPWFLNTVVEIRTELSPLLLLERLKALERQLGRHAREPESPREIDLDLLLYGDRVLDEPHLMIPHLQMHRRRFVLVPLVELAPDVIHPVYGKTMVDLLEALCDRKGVYHYEEVA
jgi:2-amino-4-hydroxy-6-hydroxymethyldihydropteridine diphosphokinase